MSSASPYVITDYLYWSTALDLPVLLGLALALYGVVIGPLRAHLAPGRGYPWRQATACGFGLACLYVALASPIDFIGERFLFSVHMLQHILLIYPVAMLLLLGLPSWLVRFVLSPPGATAIARVATHPIIAAVTFNVIFAVWHIPGFYEWALRDRLMHNLEHLTLLGSSILMWWPVLSPTRQLPRLTPGSQILYVLALAIAQLPVFAYVTFSSEVLYPTYETAVRIAPLSALQDQQLGGMIMKIAGMGFMFALLAGAFQRWSQMGQKHRAVPPLPSRGPQLQTESTS
jgi:putative membrane protein